MLLPLLRKNSLSDHRQWPTQTVPAPGWDTTLLQTLIPGLFGSLTSSDGIFLMLERFKFISLFDMTHCFLIRSERNLPRWLQENTGQFMMFNKRRRWFHSSRVRFPLVNMSMSLFLVSTYLIWILGSKLILSNNLLNRTLWVWDTCLTFGLVPLTIILITASLSSKMYN